ncbi:MAG: phosphotransferase [Planctomycetota bacterium]|nr:phosphotransferase [Planctomycetota bacterium]MDA1161382.1 phosphotransferase [Planctomycetota bacterium]
MSPFSFISGEGFLTEMLNATSDPARVLRQKFRHMADLAHARIEPVSGGFSGAGVFRVEAADTSYCLRRWPAGKTAATRILAIHQLLELARDRGILVVPIPLKSDSGTSLPEVNHQFWQLEPWMPGTANFLVEPNDERLSSAMTQLARFHNAIREWHPTAATSQWFQPASNQPCPTILSRIGMIDDYAKSITDIETALAQESDARFRNAGTQIALLFRTAHRRVRQELAAVESLAVPLQPCIRDLWHDHLLFRGDELSGVVDFGAMATDSVSCELSRLLGSLFGENSTAWQRAIRHYEAVRILTDAEHRLLRPLDFSSVLLSGMTWLKRRYFLRNTPTDLSRVCDRMESIAERLTALVLDFQECGE